MHVCPKCFSLYGSDQGDCPKDGLPTKHYTEVLVGLNLGPYIVRSMVSEGGMGVVYAGEHPTLGRRVALKVLRPELSLRDDIVERFAQEARAVNTIGHANIVSIYDFGRTPFGTFYIVMEFLEGRTLRHLLDHGGPQPLERVRFVLQGVGEALAAAHNKGFVHRDVKPENVMIGHRGGNDYVKLLDFGIAKLLTGNATTATSGAMGTPMYMSPEQLDDGKLDNRSDIFSLGGVVYELLTGQVPYPGTSHAAVRQAQLTRRPPPAGIIRRDIHIAESIDQAVGRAIELDPNARHQKVEDFIAAFRRGYDNTLKEQTQGVRRRTRATPGVFKIMLFATLVAVVLGGAVAAIVLKVLKGDSKGATTVSADAGQKVDAAALAVPPPTIDDWRGSAKKRFAEALASDASRNKALKFAHRVAPEGAREGLLRALNVLETRKGAAFALGRLPRDASKTTLSKLRVTLGRGAALFDKAALYSAVGALGDRKTCRKGLRALLKRNQTPYFRQLALPLLVRCGDRKAIKQLRKLEKTIATDMTTPKVEALAALAARGSKADHRRMLRLAQKKGTLKLQLLAAEAYSELPRARLEDLQDLLRSLPRERGDIAPRVAGIKARLGDAKAVETLVSSWRSNEVQAKRWSALELGRLKQLGRLKGTEQKAIREALTGGLRHASPDVSLAAAVALLAF